MAEKLLIFGGVFGAIVGLIHAGYVFLQLTNQFPEQLGKHTVRTRTRAAYYALWTVFLWVLMGPYVFCLWVISVFIYTGYNALKRLRASG